MKRAENGFFCLLYLTLGTYAVPALRISMGDSAIPYGVLFASILVIVLIARLLKEHASIYLSQVLLLFIIVYLLSIVVSTSIAQSPDAGITTKSALFSMTPLLVACVSDNVKVVRRALLCLAISGFAVFVYGAYGFVTGKIGSPSEHLFGFFGVTYEPATRNGDMLFLQSTFWILLSIWLFGKPGRLKPAYAIGSVLLAAGMLLSLVRGTWIATGATLIFILILGSRYRPRIRQTFSMFLLFLAATLVGITILLGPEQIELIVHRFATLSTLSLEGGSSNLARIELAKRIFGIIAVNPLGVGVGNVRYFLVDFFTGPLNHAENVYLNLCVEQGIIGVAIFILLLVWVIARLMRFLRVKDRLAEDVWVGWALLGIMISWLVYGFFNSMVDSMWYWFVLGLAVSLSNLTEREMLRQRGRTPALPFSAYTAKPTS
ncbi:MAG: O-antigen ligase family protein [Deltaproteobacteria bacterium]|nr:O-antigen ligase family protein [Deltaproteobacteria bacterium]